MTDATGVCYTKSGNVKRYEDSVSISLVKGTHDLPTINNDVTSVANENHYKFVVSSSYVLYKKGSKEDSCPLIFVTYYPSSSQNPCYFNFNYNYHKITFFLYLLTPSTIGSDVFNKILFNLNDSSKKVDLKDSKCEINVKYSDIITFNYSDYNTFYYYNSILNLDNYYVNKLGLNYFDNPKLSYYNNSINFALYHKINGVTYTDYNDNINHNITISNVTEDITAYMYVVPQYIYVHPIHGSNLNKHVWDQNDNEYGEYKMSCSGRSNNTGGNYDRGPWGAPNSDGGNRTNFLNINSPVGCVETSDTRKDGADYYNYHLGVTLTTSLYEYKSYPYNKSNSGSYAELYPIDRDKYINNQEYFAYNDVCDYYLKTLNNSPKPSTSYWGDETEDRYIAPWINYIRTNNYARRGNMGITYAKQFPQNNTYIALDRTNPSNSDQEPATTMPPQFWVSAKKRYWVKFVYNTTSSDIRDKVVPDMILQGLICGGSGGDKNHEALGLYSAISLKGKNKKPNDLVFTAEAYNTYFDSTAGGYGGRWSTHQPYNSYMITGRIKTSGSSTCENPIWQKFRFNIISNIKQWIEEYG